MVGSFLAEVILKDRFLADRFQAVADVERFLGELDGFSHHLAPELTDVISRLEDLDAQELRLVALIAITRRLPRRLSRESALEEALFQGCAEIMRRAMWLPSQHRMALLAEILLLEHTGFSLKSPRELHRRCDGIEENP